MQRVSVIIPTSNSQRTLEACLSSLDRQDFPKDALEVLLIDGGSTDATIAVAHTHRATMLSDSSGSPEAAKAMGVTKSTGDLILFLPSDNILPHRLWLKRMMEILAHEPDVIAVYPARYKHRRRDGLLTRYFSLLGANDPVAWFLGKADRAGYYELENRGSKYSRVRFDEQSMPTLGDNGFLIRKSILMKALVSADRFFHIDICLDLVRLGYDRFAVAHDSIIHDTGEQFFSYFSKRYRYMTELYLQQKHKRRYHVFDMNRDLLKLACYIVYSFTLVAPLAFSIRGYLKKPDLAWLMHPIMCVGMMMTYSFAIINNKFSSSRA